MFLGLPSTTAGIYSFVQWPQLVCNVLPFVVCVHASLLLIYFGKPLGALYPLFLVCTYRMRYVRASMLKRVIRPSVCFDPRKPFSQTARSVSEIRPDFDSGSTWLGGFLDIVVVKESASRYIHLSQVG